MPSPFPGLEGWLPDAEVFRASAFLSSIPRASGRPERAGRLTVLARGSREGFGASDTIRPLVPRLRHGIAMAILMGNAGMPQDCLVSGVRTGRTRSITEALHDAVQSAEREGVRPRTLVVHPSLMARIYKDLPIDQPVYTTTGSFTVVAGSDPIDIQPDITLPHGSAYLVDPSQLLMSYAGASPIRASSQVSPHDDSIEVRLSYAAQVIARHHRAITQLMIEAAEVPAPVTNNVLPQRTAWDMILTDWMEAA